jgi:hypothetical protein
MGESDSTASQPSKPVCDWILGRAEVDVKEKSSDSKSPPNSLTTGGLRGMPGFGPLWKTCSAPVNFPPFSGLTARIWTAYLPR